MSDTARTPRNDFFASLVERATGRASMLLPRLPLLFEPVASPGPTSETVLDGSAAAWRRDAADANLRAPWDGARVVQKARVEVFRERIGIAPQLAMTPRSTPESPRIIAAPIASKIAVGDNVESSNAPLPKRESFVQPAMMATPPHIDSDEPEHDVPIARSGAQPTRLPHAVLEFRVHEKKEIPAAARVSRKESGDMLAAAIPPQNSIQLAVQPVATSVMMPKPVQMPPLPTRQPAARDTGRIPMPPTPLPEPAINVTIGVVEVRAVEKATSSAQPRTDRNRRAPMGLEEYLKQRRG